jgi:histone H3/H4
MIIPEYNALSDPFLCGFFIRPNFRKLLKKTGANSPNKANIISRFRASASKSLNAHLSQD